MFYLANKSKVLLRENELLKKQVEFLKQENEMIRQKHISISAFENAFATMVEPIRCKDCRYCTDGGRCRYYHKMATHVCNFYPEVEPYDYCSHGKEVER